MADNYVLRAFTVGGILLVRKNAYFCSMTITLIIILALVAVGAIILYVSTSNKGTRTRVTLEQELNGMRLELSEARELSARSAERLLASEELVKHHLQEKERSAAEIATLRRSLEQMRVDKERLEERVVQFENRRQEFEAENERRFRLMASEILEGNSRRFKEQSEQRLSDILNPLKDDLERFKKTVTDAYSNESRERFALGERLKELVQLNESIGREAKELSRALRGDSKVQGDWGEMILETLLEKSGLKKGVHFDLQVTTDDSGQVLKDNAGRMLRPDAVIYYPDGRCAVVDSKVSLTGYIDLINCEAGTEEYNAAAQSHLRSVRSHIKELATKSYQDFIGDKKADFVTMFIPNEGAYLAAMNLDGKLWQEAYDQRVLIVSPTHLLSVLKLVEQMWRQDDMKKNVIAIADEGGKMYDKFVAFVEDMGRIEKAISGAEAAYKDAIGKLVDGKGNLVRRAEKIKKMGAKTTKQLSSNILSRALPDTVAPSDEEEDTEA